MGKSKYSEYPKFRIQGKTYYKINEVPTIGDLSIISEVWSMTNPKGENFKLAIRYGSKNTAYTLYGESGQRLLKTYSISEIV